MKSKIILVSFLCLSFSSLVVTASFETLFWKVEEGLNLSGQSTYYNQEGVVVDLSFNALSKLGEKGLVTITVDTEEPNEYLDNYKRTFVIPKTGLMLNDYFLVIKKDFPNFKVKVNYFNGGEEIVRYIEVQ